MIQQPVPPDNFDRKPISVAGWLKMAAKIGLLVGIGFLVGLTCGGNDTAARFAKQLASDVYAQEVGSPLTVTACLSERVRVQMANQAARLGKVEAFHVDLVAQEIGPTPALVYLTVKRRGKIYEETLVMDGYDHYVFDQFLVANSR